MSNGPHTFNTTHNFGSKRASTAISYTDLAKEVYQTGNKEGWSTKKIMEMLSNPQRYQKLKDMVSSISSILICLRGIEAAYIRHSHKLYLDFWKMRIDVRSNWRRWQYSTRRLELRRLVSTLTQRSCRMQGVWTNSSMIR